MKLLLDESLPHDLRNSLPGHDVFTVAYMGWKGLENGALLRTAAEHGFDGLITLDAGIEFRTNTGALQLAVVVLRAKSNDMDDLRPLIPELLKVLGALRAKTLVRVGV